MSKISLAFMLTLVLTSVSCKLSEDLRIVSFSPTGKETLILDMPFQGVNLTSNRMLIGKWVEVSKRPVFYWDLRSREITSIWLGWHPNGGALSLLVCSPTGFSSIERLALVSVIEPGGHNAEFTKTDAATSFIVATETGILHQMQKGSPDKTFIPAPPNNSCACNDCPHMKLNTLEKLYLCLKYEQPEILMDEELRLAAKKPIDEMLRISALYGST